MIIEKQDIGDLGFNENPPCPLCGVSMNTFLPAEGPINQFDCEKHGRFCLTVLLIPKGLVEFLEDRKACLNGTIDDFLQYGMIQNVRAHIDGDFFSPKEKEVTEKYGFKFDC